MSKKKKLSPYSPTYKWGQYDYGKGSYYDGYGFGYSYKDTKEYSPYDEYQKTGIWQGYNYRPKIERRYVEQMANAFASSYNVNIREGRGWALDLSTRTLEYNPDTLLNDTKSMVIALLLHEIGHLLHTQIIENKQSPFLEKYPNSAGEVLNLFEDFRIDEIMRQSYTGANEVYGSFDDMKDEIATGYTSKKAQILAKIADLRMEVNKRIANRKMGNTEAGLQLDEWFKNQQDNEIILKIQEMADKAMLRVTYMEYCGGIAVYPRKLANISQEAQELVDKTHHAIWLATASKDTTELLRVLEQNVYPPIEYLLQEMNDDKTKEGMRELAGDLGEWFADNLRNACNGSSESNYDKRYSNSKTKTKAHVNGGAGTERKTKDWQLGDYNRSLDEVRTDIARLSRKIENLKKKDEVPAWDGRKRSGRFDTKNAYKHRLNNTHLFKRAGVKTDMVKSYAFSFAVDISGSMEGSRIENAEKSMILLANVLHKVGIPFEVVAFDNQVKTVKDWTDGMDMPVKEKLGGITGMAGGGTDVLEVITRNTIRHRKEKNKIIVLLSDGDVSAPNVVRNEIIKAEKKHGIRTIGIGLNCGDEIKKLCNGNGIVVNNTESLADSFVSLITDVLRRRI